MPNCYKVEKSTLREFTDISSFSRFSQQTYNDLFNLCAEFFTGNGGHFTNNNLKYVFINTCTIDYYLLLLFAVYKKNIQIRRIINSKSNIPFYATWLKIYNYILGKNLIQRDWND